MPELCDASFSKLAAKEPKSSFASPGDPSFPAIVGGRDRDRTCDPYHVKVVLYR